MSTCIICMKAEDKDLDLLKNKFMYLFIYVCIFHNMLYQSWCPITHTYTCVCVYVCVNVCWYMHIPTYIFFILVNVGMLEYAYAETLNVSGQSLIKISNKLTIMTGLAKITILK